MKVSEALVPTIYYGLVIFLGFLNETKYSFSNSSNIEYCLFSTSKCMTCYNLPSQTDISVLSGLWICGLWVLSLPWSTYMHGIYFMCSKWSNWFWCLHIHAVWIHICSGISWSSVLGLSLPVGNKLESVYYNGLAVRSSQLQDIVSNQSHSTSTASA